MVRHQAPLSCVQHVDTALNVGDVLCCRIGLNDLDFEMGCDGMDARMRERAECDPPRPGCDRVPGVEAGWHWTDGSSLGDYTLWSPNEPNEWSCVVPREVCSSNCLGHCNVGVSHEDCTEVLAGGDWADSDCALTQPFVCGTSCSKTLVEGPDFNFVGSTISFHHLQFTGRVRYSSGNKNNGAGLSFINSTATMTHCIVARNTQNGIGAGAVYAHGSHLQVAFTSFEDNANNGLGSAGLYMSGGSTVRVSHSRIEHNVFTAASGSPEVNLYTGVTVRRGAGVVCDASTLRVEFTRLAYNSGAPSMILTASSELQMTGSSVMFHGRNSDVKTAAVIIEAASAANVSKSTFGFNQGPSAGAIIVTGTNTFVSLFETTFVRNVAVGEDSAAGALEVLSGGRITITRGTFENNRGESTETAAGAIVVNRASMSMYDSRVQLNTVVSAASGRGSAGVFSFQSDLILAETHIDYNDAIDPSTGQVYGSGISTSLHAIESGTIFIRETTYWPFDDQRSVIVSPGSVRGILRGGCKEHPCNMGQSCKHANFSLSCHPCPEVLFSGDGITCGQCPQGTGPNHDSTGCSPCVGNNHSTFGVCLPCPQELVVDSAHINCEACGVHRTAISAGQDVLGLEKRVCGCDDGFYNGSVVLHACFVGGYDEDMHSRTLQRHFDALKSTKQHCEACPLDVTLEPCVVCRDGAPPAVAAGYTIPQIPKEDSTSRRILQVNDGSDETSLVFRCHIELPLAKARCPEGAAPGVCNPGYEGYLCDSCIDGYGMSPARACEPCEGTGFTRESMLLLAGIIAGVGLVLWIVSKVWKAFPLKHLARCAFQPGRILITYSQITSQLGDVLDFAYPGVFGDVIEALRPVMDLWGLLFRALGPSECFGLKGFTARWLLRIIGLPAVMGTIVFLYYMYNRRLNGKKTAAAEAKGHCFFAVTAPTSSLLRV